jgi:hypothetical protein
MSTSGGTDYGVCYVRHGKAGSPPKRRSVLTVLP